jgi:hypothetical protein
MTRRGLFALLAGVFGARKLPVAPVRQGIKFHDTFTLPVIHVVNPPISGIAIMRGYRVIDREMRWQIDGKMLDDQRNYNRMLSMQAEIFDLEPRRPFHR